MLRSVAKILKRKAFRTNVYQVMYNLYLHPNSSVYWFIRITAPYARLFIGPIETLQYFEIVIIDKAIDCTFEIAIILWKLSWDVVCKLENGFKIIRHPRALPKGLNCEWKLWPFFPIPTSSLHIIILYNGAFPLVVYDLRARIIQWWGLLLEIESRWIPKCLLDRSVNNRQISPAIIIKCNMSLFSCLP